MQASVVFNFRWFYLKSTGNSTKKEREREALPRVQSLHVHSPHFEIDRIYTREGKSLRVTLSSSSLGWFWSYIYIHMNTAYVLYKLAIECTRSGRGACIRKGWGWPLANQLLGPLAAPPTTEHELSLLFSLPHVCVRVHIYSLSLYFETTRCWPPTYILISRTCSYNVTIAAAQSPENPSIPLIHPKKQQ